MKKIISLLLILISVFSLSSCSYNSNTPEEELPENYTPSPKGYEYTILSDLSSMSSLCNINDDTLISEKLRRHYKQIEEELGCTINLQITNKTIESDVFVSSTGKSDTANLIETNAKTVYRLAEGGYLTPLEEMQVDAENPKFGLDSQKNFLKMEGKTYGIFPLYLGVSAPTQSYMLYYNDKIVSSYSSLSPEILLENGKWTYSAFSEIAKQVTFTDGIRENYAFLTPSADYPDLINATLLSAGQKAVNDEGKAGYEKFKTINAIEWLKDLVCASRVSLSSSVENADIYNFANENTAFLVSSSSVGFSLNENFPQATLGENLRVVSFPTASGSIAKGSFGKNDTFYAITTRSKKDRADSSVILDRIFSVMEGDTEESWKENLLQSYFFSEKNFASYITSLENAGNDGLLKIPGFVDGFNEAWSLVVNGTKSSAQAYEEIINVLDGVLK